MPLTVILAGSSIGSAVLFGERLAGHISFYKVVTQAPVGMYAVKCRL
jgi:hypothetical protein